MKKISVKDIKKGMSRSEMRSVKGAGCGFCDTCTSSQQCCLDGSIYFCGTAGTNCARQ